MFLYIRYHGNRFGDVVVVKGATVNPAREFVIDMID